MEDIEMKASSLLSDIRSPPPGGRLLPQAAKTGGLDRRAPASAQARLLMMSKDASPDRRGPHVGPSSAKTEADLFTARGRVRPMCARPPVRAQGLDHRHGQRPRRSRGGPGFFCGAVEVTDAGALSRDGLHSSDSGSRTGRPEVGRAGRAVFPRNRSGNGTVAEEPRRA